MYDTGSVVIYGFTVKEQHILNDGTVAAYGGAFVFGDDGEGGTTVMESPYALDIYDGPQFYIYKEIAMFPSVRYTISGQCAPVGSTIYFTPKSSISDYTELADKAVASVKSDDEGAFSITMDGIDDSMLMWMYVPASLSGLSTSGLEYDVEAEAEEEEEIVLDDLIAIPVELEPVIKSVCSDCGGTGLVDGATCETCSGEGVVVVRDGANYSLTYKWIYLDTSTNISSLYLSEGSDVSATALRTSIRDSIDNCLGSTSATLYVRDYGAGSHPVYTLWTYGNEPTKTSVTHYNWSFNGIELPKPYEGFLDIETVRWLVVTAIADEYVELVGHKYNLYDHHMDSPNLDSFTLSADHTILYRETGVNCTCYSLKTQWEYAEDFQSGVPINLDARKETIIWTKYDLYDADGNLYMAGNKPTKVYLEGTFLRPFYINNSDSTASCLSADTLITMADSTYKRMDEIRVGDVVMSKDGSPTEVCRVGRGFYNSHHLLYTFDDDTVIDETHEHRFFNVDQGFYQNLNRWNIGDRAKHQNGSTPALVSVEQIDETVECFGIWTESGTYFANNLLSGSAECNVDFVADASIEDAMDMALSLNESQLLRLFDSGGVLL